jgi:hypothetical protein
MRLLLIACCAFLVIPSMAQIPQNHYNCSPSGTWYGGGDFKYVITITPLGGDRFAMRGEGAYSQAAWGYTGWTSFSSELIRLKDGRYVSYGIAMYTTSPEMQPPSNSIELDGVRGWLEFTDCNNVRASYDFYAAYFDLNKIPFVDPPDVNYLPPGGISETYHRMPTKCPACGLASVTAGQPQLRRR